LLLAFSWNREPNQQSAAAPQLRRSFHRQNSRTNELSISTKYATIRLAGQHPNFFERNAAAKLNFV